MKKSDERIKSVAIIGAGAAGTLPSYSTNGLEEAKLIISYRCSNSSSIQVRKLLP